MTQDMVERVKRGIAEAKTRWTMGNKPSDPDFEHMVQMHLEMPSLDPIAQAAIEATGVEELRDKAENLIIAIGMGWDLNGCVEALQAHLEKGPQ